MPEQVGPVSFRVNLITTGQAKSCHSLWRQDDSLQVLLRVNLNCKLKDKSFLVSFGRHVKLVQVSPPVNLNH